MVGVIKYKVINFEWELVYEYLKGIGLMLYYFWDIIYILFDVNFSCILGSDIYLEYKVSCIFWNCVMWLFGFRNYFFWRFLEIINGCFIWVVEV